MSLTTLLYSLLPPLSSRENYPIWSSGLRTILKTEGLWEMVQGTHELPEPNTTAINGIDFVVGEHLRASAYIQGSIAKEIRMRFMADEFDDPALLWKKLENVFGEDVVGMGG